MLPGESDLKHCFLKSKIIENCYYAEHAISLVLIVRKHVIKIKKKGEGAEPCSCIAVCALGHGKICTDRSIKAMVAR
jgi:hypothetical protein